MSCPSLATRTELSTHRAVTAGRQVRIAGIRITAGVGRFLQRDDRRLLGTPRRLLGVLAVAYAHVAVHLAGLAVG